MPWAFLEKVSGRRRQIDIMIREFNMRPFNLEEPPLFRLLLIKVEAGLSILACCMHHIVSDGWSMEILERDFQTVYKALRENRGIEPPPALAESAWMQEPLCIVELHRAHGDAAEPRELSRGIIRHGFFHLRSGV